MTDFPSSVRITCVLFDGIVLRVFRRTLLPASSCGCSPRHDSKFVPSEPASPSSVHAGRQKRSESHGLLFITTSSIYSSTGLSVNFMCCEVPTSPMRCKLHFQVQQNIYNKRYKAREREHAMQRHGQRRFRMPLFSGKKWERALAFVGPGPLLNLTVTVDTVAPSNHHRSFRKKRQSLRFVLHNKGEGS